MDLNNGYTPAPKPLTPEEMKIRRKKELAIIKASNQMLEEAKNELLGMNENDIDNSKYADMPNFSLKDKIEMIDAAKSQNLTMANAYYNADENEVNAQEYGEPDAIEVKKYERRLKAKGLTDEQLHNKDMTKGGISYGDENDKAKVSKGDGLKQKTRRKRNTKKNAEEEKAAAAVIERKVAEIESKKIEEVEAEPVNIDEEKQKVKDMSYSFDVSSIPDYVQYDVIPLPSKGECYKHKKSRIPVAYLTAADENIIASPNMYRDGKLIDIILKRKILDKDIVVEELTSGDRDAITLWLRATAYGAEYPITATDPLTRKQVDAVVDLAKFNYFDFNLKGDEDGLFTFEIGGNV